MKIYHSEPELYWNVSEIDTGTLIQELLEEPLILGNIHEKGEIKLNIERTHEWEIVLELLINGSGEFVAGVIGGIGGILAQWLVNKAAKSVPEKPSEIRVKKGNLKVVVSPENLEQATKDSVDLLTQVIAAGGEVQIIVRSDD